MRILHVFKTYLPEGFAGVERVIWAIAEGAVGEGVESAVFTLSKAGPRPAARFGDHAVHYAPMSIDIASTPIAFNAWAAFRAQVEWADIVHYHFPWPMMDLLHFFGGGRRKPSIVTYHSDIVKQAGLLKLYQPLMLRFLGSVDRIVATSPNYLATSPVLARFRDKSLAIPLGIDPASVKPDPETTAAWRKRVPERFFLFVGELRYYKGVPFLIEAARRTGYPVLLAGKGELSAEEMRTLPSNVRLLGAVSDADKAALLSLCEGFVFPSHLRSEAFGVALLEAAFAGRPMISCEIGTGTSFANLDGETGIVVPPADPEALAAAMRRLWDEPELRARLGANAVHRALDLFQASQMASAYCAIYRELAETGVRPGR